MDKQQDTRRWILFFYAILPAGRTHLALPTQASIKSIFLHFRSLEVVSLDGWMFSQLLSISIITINKVLSWSTNPDFKIKSINLSIYVTEMVSIDISLFGHLLPISIITINKVLSWSTKPDFKKKHSLIQDK